MYHFYRTIMLALLWLSLLLIPYFFFFYIGYGGLIGGPEANEVRTHSYYVSITGYYIWLYPLVIFYSLYLSRKLKPSFHSISILWVPIVFLIPVGYISYQVRIIQNKYAQQREAYYSIHSDDFVCSPGKFIRYDPSGRPYFLFFDRNNDPSTRGKAWIISYLYDGKELKEFLIRKNINKQQCKNQKGEPITDSFAHIWGRKSA